MALLGGNKPQVELSWLLDLTLHHWHDIDDSELLKVQLEAVVSTHDLDYTQWQGQITRLVWTLQAIKENITGAWEVIANQRFTEGWKASLHGWVGTDPIFRLEEQPCIPASSRLI